ncbi:uncharacterized protein G2W53_003828 [Senna tora]|uniref:Uncharacterized protein n=1 Tax=Senna tora TaxID=362788 RepID=A0A835CIS3_9FABA|nr:uncharacterized protein G2W53_003828 [Senna tora]
MGTLGLEVATSNKGGRDHPADIIKMSPS